MQKLAKEAGWLDAGDMSAHSLRRGFGSNAAREDASMSAIEKQGRRKRTQTVLAYIEAGREFREGRIR